MKIRNFLIYLIITISLLSLVGLFVSTLSPQYQYKLNSSIAQGYEIINSIKNFLNNVLEKIQSFL